MKLLTPLKSIRQKCLDCCAFQKREVALCAAVNCPLHPYRFGHRPTGEENAAGAEIERETLLERGDKYESF